MPAVNSARQTVRRFRPAGLPFEFLGYFACSALALGLDTALYLGSLAAGLGLACAVAVGFLSGLVLAYVLSTRWVFRVRRVSQPWLEFALFAGIGLAGLGLTEALLWLSVSHWGAAPLMAKLLTAGAVFMFNFGARKALLFSRQRNNKKKLAYA
ncbi:MAG TPA: GtrA family protein [Burkholderiaceae bacterium]|jgi:putative flippase GtrA